MRRQMRTTMLLTFLGVAGLALPFSAWAADPAKTAQSAMITLDKPDFKSFKITTTYAFTYPTQVTDPWDATNTKGRACPVTYLHCKEKTYKYGTGSSTAKNTTCSGTGTEDSALTVDPVPPPSDTSQNIKNYISANDCAFFDDTTLQDPQPTNDGTCTKASSTWGSCSGQTCVNSFQKVIECTVDTSIPRSGYDSVNSPDTAPTCWEFDREHTTIAGQLPAFLPSGTLAAEAALCSRQQPLKYSFTMADPSNLVNFTRVTGLNVTLIDDTDPNATQVLWKWYEGGSNDGWGDLQVVLPDTNKGINFPYLGANGANGNVGLLTSAGTNPGGALYNTGCGSEQPNGASVNDIFINVPACYYVLSSTVAAYCSANGQDTFAGNNGIGGDLVTYQTVGAYQLTDRKNLANYRITVAGNLKGVNGTANLSIAQVGEIKVHANYQNDKCGE